MERRMSPGFSLIEMVITVMVLGLVLAFAVPIFTSWNQTQKMHGAAEDVAAQIRMAREKAIGTGIPQPIHFVGTSVYHIHYPAGIAANAVWALPSEVSFARNMSDWYRMDPNGRCVMTGNADGVIPLVDDKGRRDTITVQTSGLVTIR